MLLSLPDRAQWLLVLAHGAGAGMRHPFMEALAARLHARDVATLRYEFPYMAAGKKRPDRPDKLHAAVRAACAEARARAPHLRLAAGGKSMGGRMTSQALSEAPEERVEACVFFGFPLHPAKRPSTDRAAHLPQVPVPLLFLQGERDALADLTLLRPIVAALPRATLVEFPLADHGFDAPKRAGDVIDALAARAAAWLHDLRTVS